ncbi:MAG: DUF58 domain-containing protein [Pseudomonadota bacterium]
MRPTRRLLLLSFAALVLSVLIAVVTTAPASVAILPWALLFVAFVVDFAAGRRGGFLSLSSDLPAEIFVGETVTVMLDAVNRTGTAPAGLTCRIAVPTGLDAPGETKFETTPQGAQAAFPLTARRRGVYRIERVWLRWTGPVGLVEFIPSTSMDLTVVAVPNVRPIRSGQIDVLVRSSLYGAKENVLRGDGSDFHQLRDFTQGMDVRAIDWKRSARHRSLVAKEMRAERNHQIVLALDNGYLMREELSGVPKIDHQISAALALAWAGVIGGDKVGLFAFDARPRLYLPPEPGRAAFTRIRTHSAELDYKGVEANHTLAIAHLHQKLKRRSLIVVFSDFVDSTTAELLVENIAVLNKLHVIIFVTLGDPALRSVAAKAATTLTDVALAVSAEQFLKERRLVLERLSRIGVMCIEADPRQITPQLISTYLTIKARELI